jgi:DNA-directed RNA polymerase subunit F
MSDLVERLRRAASHDEYGHHAVAAVLREAAEEIENLRGRLSRHANRVQEQEIEQLRAALEELLPILERQFATILAAPDSKAWQVAHARLVRAREALRGA